MCLIATQSNAQLLKCDSLKNSGQNLNVYTSGTKSIFINSSKDLYLSSQVGRIQLTPPLNAGIVLGGNVGLGIGSNWSQTSPINCVALPHYIDNADALSKGANIGDFYITTDSLETKFLIGIVQ